LKLGAIKLTPQLLPRTPVIASALIPDAVAVIPVMTEATPWIAAICSEISVVAFALCSI